MDLKIFCVFCGLFVLALSGCAAAYCAGEVCGCSYNFTVGLNSGWNLISVPLMPENDSIDYVLGSISGKYTDVYTYHSGWKFKANYNGEWFGELERFEVGKGYWIKVSEDVNLTFTGCVVESYIFSLDEGWNLIGFTSLVSKKTDVFSDYGDYEGVYGWNSDLANRGWVYKTFFYGLWWGDLGSLEPGKGYWVKMKKIKTVGALDFIEVNYTENNTNYNVKFREGSKTYDFEDSLIGMKIGENKNIIIIESSNVTLSHDVEENTVYNTPQEEIKVFNVTNTTMYIGNKLAGETLYFNITLKNISSNTSKKECLAKYNITTDEVVFYHANWCPHCVKMVPWVEDLQSNGYKFLFAESSNTSAMDILKDCMSDVLQLGGGIPQFGCPSNGQMHIGEFPSTDDMKKFADDCRAAAKLQEDKKKECISKYNITSETVFFYHANWCPHCQKMVPWAQDLQGKGYKFLFAESSNTSAMDILKDCMSDVLQLGGGIPQFGCPSNGQMHIGEFPSTDDMKKFADDCRAAANTANIATIGSSVTVSYVGKLKTGEIFDNGTITFKIGGGQMIPGFDEAVNGMKINENKNVEIPPDKAYGYPYPAQRMQEISVDQFKNIFGEDPVLNKTYSVSGLPWNLKAIAIDTTTRNITVKILNITSGLEAFFSGNGIIQSCAINVSVDRNAFYECYSSGDKKAVIDADVNYAFSLGVGGTPTFYTGCNASIIEEICASLPSSAGSCRGRLKTNAKLDCREDGKYLIYEFTDLQCPYCYGAEQLVNELRNRTEVKLNVKLFPLSFHKDSDKESYASECARDQGKLNEFISCAFRKYFEEGVRQIE